MIWGNKLIVYVHKKCTYCHLFPCGQVFPSLCCQVVASSDQWEKVSHLYCPLTAGTSVSAWVAGASLIQKDALLKILNTELIHVKIT